jgi:hypothetical protein
MMCSLWVSISIVLLAYNWPESVRTARIATSVESYQRRQ